MRNVTGTRVVNYVPIYNRHNNLVAKLPRGAARQLANEVPSVSTTGTRGGLESVQLLQDGDMAEVGSRGWSHLERLPSGRSCWAMASIPTDLRPLFFGVVSSVLRK